MAPSKHTFLAPGQLRKNGIQVSKASFLPGFGTSSLRPLTSVVANKKTFPSSSQNPNLEENIIPSANEFHIDMRVENGEENIVDESVQEEEACDSEVVRDDATRGTTEFTASVNITKKRKRAPNAKTRGVNKCNEVASLKEGEKLEVDFFHNGPVGKNHTAITRHMGKLIRDRTVCPVRVHSWEEIDDTVKEHLWQSVLNKFGGSVLESQCETIMKHMRRLWQNWRGLMKRDHIDKYDTLKEVLEDIPNHLTEADWAWLVHEHYLSANFQKVSARNSENRGLLKMPHRTGSMPFRQVIYERMGGKEGKRPSVSEVFKETRKSKAGTLGEEETTKYEEIVRTERDNPSFSAFEVIEKCFGEQDRDHVVCFGFGMTPKDVRGPLPSRAELTTMLHEKEKENNNLMQRIDEMEVNHQNERKETATKMKSLEEKIDMLMRMVQVDNSDDVA